MRRTVLRSCFAILAALALPSLVAAQMPTLQAVQVADIETMKGKFVGLAQEFTEAQYDWRPMEGVRSVRDVLSLIVSECHMFPNNWGVQPPAGAAAGFGPEIQRTQALSKAQMIAELGTAFDHLAASVRNMSSSDLMAESTYFGRQMSKQANVMTAMADMHEHLGQLIAYARTNNVVPPWSR
jgi:uncharacterized damage-inducible protein DinB